MCVPNEVEWRINEPELARVAQLRLRTQAKERGLNIDIPISNDPAPLLVYAGEVEQHLQAPVHLFATQPHSVRTSMLVLLLGSAVSANPVPFLWV